jgi:MoaA/NifB/PqqE/SkfB family radical SAM enzyme
MEENAVQDIWQRIEMGKEYRRRSQYDLAEKELKEVLNSRIDQEQAEHAHMYLGEVYRLQGRGDLAMQEFKSALEINPENETLNKWIAKMSQVPGLRKGIAPYRIFFTWGMHYECNYRCSYCYAPKPEKPCFAEEKKNCASYLNAAEWQKVWGEVYRKYGACRIRLDGGEPSIYPSFIDLVESVSSWHYLQINTNLSFDPSQFVNKISPEKVRIDASLHLEYVSLPEFVGKIRFLHENGFKIVASCVAYPPVIDKVKECKKPFEDMRIPFVIHPFSGEFNGKSYPKAYEMKEAEKIYSAEEVSRVIMSWRKGEINATKGKLCRMGQMYARIYPNADVYRCCAEGGTQKIGNLRDDSFNLLDESLPCERESCPCWKSMVVGDERRWVSQWMDDWEQP